MLFSMDRLLGREFEAGLAGLKSLAERQAEVRAAAASVWI